MRKIEHIGIAVKDLDKAIAQYKLLLNTPCYKKEYVPSQNVHTAFFRTGTNKIELLASDDEDNVINRFIAKNGEGIHHIAYDVADILKEIERLRAAGFSILNDTPIPGADNKLVCFIHPRSVHGVLTELCQARE